jgi:hypothetical protein
MAFDWGDALGGAGIGGLLTGDFGTGSLLGGLAGGFGGSGVKDALGKDEDPISSISGESAANDYGYVDYTGASKKLQNSLYGSNGILSGAGDAMSVYNQYSNQVANQVSGMSGPLQTSLNKIAEGQSDKALSSAGQNFANLGALQSGAGASAFGEALASPFAQAQASLQGQQLSAASGALSSLMGVSGSAYNQRIGAGLGAASDLMQNTSGLVAPQYYTNPSWQSGQNLRDILLSGGKSGANSAGTTALAGLFA